MRFRAPYEVEDGDYVKFIEKIHQASRQQTESAKQQAFARLNASNTYETPRQSMERIRAQHERTMQSLQHNTQKAPTSTTSTINVGTMVSGVYQKPTQSLSDSMSASQRAHALHSKQNRTQAQPRPTSTPNRSSVFNRSAQASRTATANKPPKIKNKFTNLRDAMITIAIFLTLLLLFGELNGTANTVITIIFSVCIFLAFGFNRAGHNMHRR